MTEFPGGTVTLMFTDIEGSTRLVQELGDGYGAVLKELRQILRDAVLAKGGHEVDCRADELFAVFERSRDGLDAAVIAQETIGAHNWPEGVDVRVRIGLHTGEPTVDGDVYLGLDVNRTARICAAAHGGQVLLSRTTRDLTDDHAELRDLGTYLLAGLPRPEQLFQLVRAGLRSEFPAPRAKSTNQRHLRLALPGRRRGQPTLEDGARLARKLLPDVTAELRKPLAELSAQLFTARRAVGGATGFLLQVDRERLGRRLAEQCELALVSRQAALEVERLDRGIATVDSLEACLKAFDQLVVELPGTLDSSVTATQIASLSRRTIAATDELDQAVTRAAAALTPESYKLTRTSRRGIYRAGYKYVVPYADDFGRERRREFHTLAEAREFLRALHLGDSAKIAWKGSVGGGTKGGE